MGWLMYYKDDRDQLGIDEFFLPFGGKLKKDNRWVRTAGVMPWDYIEEVYLESMSQETGRVAFPARLPMERSMSKSKKILPTRKLLKRSRRISISSTSSG